MAAVQAMHDTLKSLREGTPPSKLKGLASSDLIKQLTRGATYQDWQDEFLS